MRMIYVIQLVTVVRIYRTMGNLNSQCLGEFFPFIQQNTDELVCFITTEYGLLNVLVSKKVLTYSQVNFIRRIDHRESRVRQLLEEITGETL